MSEHDRHLRPHAAVDRFSLTHHSDASHAARCFHMRQRHNLKLYTQCPVGECARLRQNVPYVKVHRYNPKHLYPKLKGYGDNGERKVWSSCCSTYCTCFAWLPVHCACPSFSLTAESSTFRLHYQQMSQLQ